MGLRDYITRLSREGKLVKISKEVSRKLEASGILKALEPNPVIFEKVEGTDFKVVGNLFCNREALISYLGISENEFIPLLTKAVENPKKNQLIKKPPCQEVVESKVDLNQLPIFLHCKRDGGNYISSAVVITRDPEYGQNMDFHRAMQIGKNRMSTRVVKGRHFHHFLEKNGELEVAYCIGNPPNVLLAAATSVDIGIDELHIANAIQDLTVTKAKSVDLYIPSECELVLEGRVYLNERNEEGPFVDLTGTYDRIRIEPIFEVKQITHRVDTLWQALLPGGLEHKLLMGTPREPMIYKRITDTGVKCLDVTLTQGGCSWLHAIVKIEKKRNDDGRRAIKATFEAHKSCKHVFIVDEDINIYNPLEVEWAMATRFQGDKNILSKPREAGSSLDPSANPETGRTAKIGFDMTKPLEARESKNYEKARYPQVDPSKYMKV